MIENRTHVTVEYRNMKVCCSYTENEDVESQKELEDWEKYGRGNSLQPAKLAQVLA